MARLVEPLRFGRLFLEKVWGGRALERCPGIALPEGVRVGETWEVVDRPGQESRVVGGPFEGASLSELVRRHREDLLGKAPATPEGRFPLLVKYIDAEEALSVQVHPDDVGAKGLGGGAEGKTEAWYFLDARPGGAVWCGLRPGVDGAALERALGTRDLVGLLEHHPVRAGTSLTVPGGTVHAIGAGVTLLEVQQNSDTTYRLYDWDRPGLDGKPREMHLREGRAAMRSGPAAPAPAEPVWRDLAEGGRWAPMARSDHFAMNRLDLGRPTRLGTGEQFRIYAAIEGSGRIVDASGRTSMECAPGDVVLVPAAGGLHLLEPLGSRWGLVQLFYRD